MVSFTCKQEQHLENRTQTALKLPVTSILKNERLIGSIPIPAYGWCAWRTTGNDIWVHAIDLHGYGTQQFTGPKTNIIAGWSEKVFNFILLAEQGEGNLEKAIEAYNW